MKEAGIREARQNLSALIQQVAKGHEVTITDRGWPVARLVAPRVPQRTPFAGLTEFRRRMPVLGVPLSTTIIDDRGDDPADDRADDRAGDPADDRADDGAARV